MGCSPGSPFPIPRILYPKVSCQRYPLRKHVSHERCAGIARSDSWGGDLRFGEPAPSSVPTRPLSYPRIAELQACLNIFREASPTSAPSPWEWWARRRTEPSGWILRNMHRSGCVSLPACSLSMSSPPSSRCPKIDSGFRYSPGFPSKSPSTRPSIPTSVDTSGFHEAEVEPDLDGAAVVKLVLTGGEGPFEVDARYEWLQGRLLTSVRIRPAPRKPREPFALGHSVRALAPLAHRDYHRAPTELNRAGASSHGRDGHSLHQAAVQ